MSLVASAMPLLTGGGDPFEYWQPSTISGFALDVNPHFRLTTGLDGARVTCSQVVNNVSGASDTFANINPSLQPTFESNGWGGTYRRPAILFNGTSHYLSSSSTLASSLVGGNDTPFTLFLVGQFVSLPGGATASCPFFIGRTTSNFPLWDFFEVSGAWKTNKRGDSGSIVGASGGSSDTSRHLWEIVHHGTTVDLTVGGSSIFSGSAQDVVSLTTNTIALGATYGSASPGDWANFRLARCLAFTGALGSTDLTTVRSQLIAMYL